MAQIKAEKQGCAKLTNHSAGTIFIALHRTVLYCAALTVLHCTTLDFKKNIKFSNRWFGWFSWTTQRRKTLISNVLGGDAERTLMIIKRWTYPIINIFDSRTLFVLKDIKRTLVSNPTVLATSFTQHCLYYPKPLADARFQHTNTFQQSQTCLSLHVCQSIFPWLHPLKTYLTDIGNEVCLQL